MRGVRKNKLVSVENMQISCMSDEHLEGEAAEFRLRQYFGSTKKLGKFTGDFWCWELNGNAESPTSNRKVPVFSNRERKAEEKSGIAVGCHLPAKRKKIKFFWGFDWKVELLAGVRLPGIL
jgi:hypothetical protein